MTRFAALSVVLPCLAAQTVDYQRDIQPILASRCYACHGETVKKHGLRLDRKANALAGGESGAPAVVPGNPDASLMVKYISGQDKDTVMPPAGPRLTAEQITKIRTWIEQGANWPEAGAEAGDSRDARGRRHWAFQPRKRVTPPAVKDASWVRNPIDAFILAKLESKGWRPSPSATPAQLLRRVYFDVTGLPPTLAEQDKFDRSPQALDRIVDDLLARPTYAERWARHWLDVVRYADTNGYERDALKPSVWRYRDYVIRAFWNDKPFDRFLLEQLAGDELPDATDESRVATGYFRLGPWDDEPADPATDRYDQLDDMLSTTSQAFLGLTLGCARCHNHKFEPLSARDYYSMVAIFNPLDRPRKGRTELDLPMGSPMQIAALAARDKRIEDLQKRIAAAREAAQKQFLDSGECDLPAAVIDAFKSDPKQRTEPQRRLIARYQAFVDKEFDLHLPQPVRNEIKGHELAIAALRRETPDLPRGYFLHEPKPQPPPTFLLIRGKPGAHGPEVPPAVPAVLVTEQPSFPQPAATSLRRLTFAKWLANPENPLTARVIVNRIWQRHFGLGLVRTPSDFGVMGERPTHPELLDWLANWFVDNGWSIRKLNRLILTSNVYRMSKASNARYVAEDPENRMLWRMPSQRLEVEAIRDSMLAVSGRLNPKMFGPSMVPRIPVQALEGHPDANVIWNPSDDEESSRRTIYALVKRSMVIPMLELLDFCDTARTSAQRMTTSVAPQALTLFNGDFVNQEARYLASRLINETGWDPERQIDRAYRLTLSRPPTSAERDSMRTFLSREAAGIARESGEDRRNAQQKALEQMCRVIFNLNEFVYTD
ncbi:MAG: PSD1 and planctomycete cytochrome C domain-containing protein [Bryobacteraceae bacterium]